MRDLDSAIVSGFDMFMSSGSLCNERVKGMAVVVEKWEADSDVSDRNVQNLHVSLNHYG